MMLVLGVGGTLPIGYQISVIGYPSGFIKQFMNETLGVRWGQPPSQETILFLWSLVVSIFGVGGVLGSLGSGYLALRFGK
ncbi:solute carrier family 2, facilitated glucose transporter member 11-like isoform X2 [Sceloporus undulatus]|nr:solute carrier family 2, facilitated glucose transporter member 11-like isoform X2 [Sceloporus undulatus]